MTELGVKHVMRVFARHFFEGQAATVDTTEADASHQRIQADRSVACDEEVIELALQQGRS